MPCAAKGNDEQEHKSLGKCQSFRKKFFPVSPGTTLEQVAQRSWADTPPLEVLKDINGKEKAGKQPLRVVELCLMAFEAVLRPVEIRL
ncbi:hypothetical protein HGM15179_003775 [Zosterops borbonicus]|uniref:Uncharacterized protein n=1 Tax=Zosterops borbonicus TaxID=364589 RepID=A0A8K1LRS8_9PASS|nr:hypothetical protein HGM15179_003775 [Zosterops borbonicus]